MGSASAMNSINRVLEAHGDEIMEEWTEQVPDSLSGVFKNVDLYNATYGIKVHWIFKCGSSLEGPFIDIDTLAEQYPDCEVGY